ncbi:hypothetical protein EYF80_010180 [Liparis tanakae]|uniref:Uncharacterized protein n=1 Tax=Liparis tanakae TaxID=230148 RepID=A0A4Z2IPK1_9TELE|nr:hypothetical protein EYF80_010180 [Liparis tanakae]
MEEQRVTLQALRSERRTIFKFPSPGVINPGVASTRAACSRPRCAGGRTPPRSGAARCMWSSGGGAGKNKIQIFYAAKRTPTEELDPDGAALSAATGGGRRHMENGVSCVQRDPARRPGSETLRPGSEARSEQYVGVRYARVCADPGYKAPFLPAAAPSTSDAPLCRRLHGASCPAGLDQ